MTDTRSAILRRIRATRTDVQTPDAGIARDYRREGERGRGELVALFTERLHDYGAAVHPTAEADLPARLAELLDGRDCVLAPGLPPGWQPPRSRIDQPPLTVAELDRTAAVITSSSAASATTGTIALDGGSGQGRRALTLVPDWHICGVRADDIVHTVPELLARLAPDRPTTLISGASATRDIELHRIQGVHGPRTPDGHAARPVIPHTDRGVTIATTCSSLLDE
ncbi:LUD domain-containing protein [Rhodococcus opacus]|uniref:LUD domain-containing protein n=1 Tax=Rhodococcus opacus TaxID=37919 RepID=A0AAX3Y579_RHOOP|nr:LUD domain-containing protein [Rhodococcus opacus]MCZ4589977.1 LUD domain-containing protein [Rhodococcus opacus]WLF44502.1 LUD domain-containing protein [Rhodococcus opacus]